MFFVRYIINLTYLRSSFTNDLNVQIINAVTQICVTRGLQVRKAANDSSQLFASEIFVLERFDREANSLPTAMCFASGCALLLLCYVLNLSLVFHIYHVVFHGF